MDHWLFRFAVVYPLIGLSVGLLGAYAARRRGDRPLHGAALGVLGALIGAATGSMIERVLPWLLIGLQMLPQAIRNPRGDWAAP